MTDLAARQILSPVWSDELEADLPNLLYGLEGHRDDCPVVEDRVAVRNRPLRRLEVRCACCDGVLAWLGNDTIGLDRAAVRVWCGLTGVPLRLVQSLYGIT